MRLDTVIIEDEYEVAQNLISLLEQNDSFEDINVLAILSSIQDSVGWLLENPAPDLIFMDINLSDGLSFQIFEEIKVKCPIIFTTAYDQYAIKAFKLNSIDYLLKPISRSELNGALEKYKSTYLKQITADDLRSLLPVPGKQYKTRFLVTEGKKMKWIGIDKVAYFYGAGGMVLLISKDGNQNVVSSSLNELEEKLDPLNFLRINRNFLINIESVIEIENYFNNRLIVKLKPTATEPAIVSRPKVAQFKNWLEGA